MEPVILAAGQLEDHKFEGQCGLHSDCLPQKTKPTGPQGWSVFTGSALVIRLQELDQVALFCLHSVFLVAIFFFLKSNLSHCDLLRKNVLAGVSGTEHGD